jgi:hypothetical protein
MKNKLEEQSIGLLQDIILGIIKNTANHINPSFNDDDEEFTIMVRLYREVARWCNEQVDEMYDDRAKEMAKQAADK